MSDRMTKLTPFLFLLALPFIAFAGSATATLRVSVRIVASCSVTTQPLTLTPHVSGSPHTTETSQAGAIVLQCSKGTPVRITLDKGPLVGPSGASVAYTLDAPTSAIGQGREPVSLPVVGSVAGGQTMPPGDYTGEAIVRVDY